MSLKNLFGKSFKSFNSGTVDLESTTYADKQVVERQTYLPPIDFATASNFAKYGLAEMYYADAISRIYNYYPYDGSKAEVVEFHQSSSYLDRWMYNEKYPKTTGYATLGTTANYTANADGYGRTSTPEYILTWGGLYTGSSPLTSKNLKASFEQPAKYKLDLNRTQNWRTNPVSGSTIEFWLKIPEFDTVNKTKSQVILDLWNGVADGSGTGRLTLELYKASSGADSVFRLTMRDTAPAGPQQQVVSDSITDASLASWHHYALTIKNGTTGIDTILYIDGTESKKVTDLGGVGATLTELPGRLTGFIGAMQTPLPSGDGATNAAKLSGSLDEFRFWKTARKGRQIGLNWFRQIGGGANTDDSTANNDLGVYYRFNEGIVGNDSIDSIVLDYSGRIANGQWIGYSSGQNQRHTGSALTFSEHSLVEELNPILRPTHSRIVSLETIMAASGSDHDNRYGNSLYYSLPAFLVDEDINGNLKKLTQIFATYFDTLHAQITALPKLKDKRYVNSTDKALPFASELLKDKGFVVKDIFTNPEIVELISNADINAVRFEENIDEIKNLIYTNIYNNLEAIYKSKGTEKSIRNLIRCFGIDDEIIKLNVYTDGGTHYFNDKAKGTSVKKKYIKFDNGADTFKGTVYQTSSTNNTLSFISGSLNSAKTSAENNAFTLEADVFVPYKPSPGEPGYHFTPMLSCSVFGFHQADALDPGNFTWRQQSGGERELANLQVYLVRDSQDSRNAKFELRNVDKRIRISSDWINNIYDNNHWNLALRIKPVTYPYAGNVTTTAANPVEYSVELYGVSHNFDQVENEISLKTTINNTSGSGYLNYAKRVYAGAEYTNFTGTLANRSDIQIGGVRAWLDYVDNATIKEHNKDPLNFGNPKSYRGSNLFTVENKHIPSEDLTILNWDFDTVTGTDAHGEFTIEDITSGTLDVVYDTWIDEIIRRENKGRGRYFKVSNTTIAENEYLYAQRKELPEISYTNDNVFIKGEKEINFITDDDVSDNFYALEVSMNQIVSEEMLRLFASIQEYANLMSRPVDHYRINYKRMDSVREEFFSRVTTDLDQEAFINYYKWIDQSISEMVAQLVPASVNYAPGVTDTIESHILERNKYQRNPGLTYNIDVDPEASARGVEELTYNWKLGHSPNWHLKKAIATVTLNNVGIANFYDTVLRITDASGTLKRYILRNTAPSNTGTTVSLDPGSGAVAHVVVGVSGLTYITAVAQLVNAIKSANGHNGTIIAEDKSGGTLGLIQAKPGLSGNIAIIGQSTVTDGSSTWSSFGIGTTSGFTGGVDSPENVNCLWQFERKERSDITDRERIRQVLVNETNVSSSTLATAKKTTYQGSTYARRRLSKPYKFAVDFGNTLHGGTNYRKQKDRNFFKMAINVRGKKGSSGEPLNVFAIGLGKGNDIVGPKDCLDKESPTAKKYYDAIITAGKFSTGQASHTLGAWSGYEYRLSNGKYWPSNFVSASVKSGYNNKIDYHFKSGSVVTNLHSDTVYIGNDIPMQGPFTNTHVGGNQHRHVEINRYDKDLRNPGTTGTPNQLQTQYTRPEAWRLLVGDNPSSVTPDGAIGYVGADYGGPYPDPTRKWAIYSREETAKRPVNIRNIESRKKGWDNDKSPSGVAVRRVTGSYWLGNYTKKYEVLHTVGYREQKLLLRDLGHDFGLFGNSYKSLPKTTQPTSLLGAGTLLNIPSAVLLQYGAVANLATNSKFNGLQFIFHNPSPLPESNHHVITIDQASSTTNKDQIGLNSVTTDSGVRTKIRAAIDAAIAAGDIKATRTTSSITDILIFKNPGEANVTLSSGVVTYVVITRYQKRSRGSGHRSGIINFLPNESQLTKEQKTVIRTRFSAPGGIDQMSPAFLDVSSQEYSVYNTLNYRNLSVRSSGSGEVATLRVNSDISRRNGLRTLLARHCGKGGLDSEYDSLSYFDSGSKDPQAAFFKQNRNALWRPEVTKTARRMAIHVPYHAAAGDCGLETTSFRDWPTNHPPLSFSFWFKGDDPIQDASNDRTIMYLGGAGEINVNIQFKANTKQLQVALGGGSNMTEWLYDAAPLYDSWAFYTIVWGGDEDTAPKIYYNNIEISLSNTTYHSGGFKSIKYSNLDPATSLAFFDNSTGAIGELEGSLANFAIWKKELSLSERKALYEQDGDPLRVDEMFSVLIDYWRLGTEPQFVNLTDGLRLNTGKTIPSSIGKNGLTTNFGLSGSIGPYDHVAEIKDKRVYDNMFVSSLLPRSDFQYSWINGTLSCSVGDWLLDQKVRGYAPLSGKITVVGGSSVYKSVNAIEFPTISDITCCAKGTGLTMRITIPAQPDGVSAQSFTTNKSIELVDDSVGVAATNKILESYLDQMTIGATYEASCCEEDTLKYHIVWWNDGDTEPEGTWQNSPVWPVGNVDILATDSSDDIVYIRVTIKDCDSQTVSILITLSKAKT